jgi:hypothetical protein
MERTFRPVLLVRPRGHQKPERFLAPQNPDPPTWRSVTILAASSASAVLTASLAAAIVAAEGIQQLFKLQPVWLDYRRTANALRRVAMSYLVREKPYHDPQTRRKKLAEATQTLLSGEASNWEGVRAQTGDSGS